MFFNEKLPQIKIVIYLYICMIIAHNGERSKYPIALINEHESVQNVFRSSVMEIQKPGRNTNANVMKDV